MTMFVMIFKVLVVWAALLAALFVLKRAREFAPTAKSFIATHRLPIGMLGVAVGIVYLWW